jgi:hypothetical protein
VNKKKYQFSKWRQQNKDCLLVESIQKHRCIDKTNIDVVDTDISMFGGIFEL